MDGNGWQVSEGPDFELGAMQCGGLRVVEEIIASVKYAVSRNPYAFGETTVSGIRIAKTKMHFRGSEIIFGHSIRFRVLPETKEVVLLWIEVTNPDQLDEGSIW